MAETREYLRSAKSETPGPRIRGALTDISLFGDISNKDSRYSRNTFTDT